MSRGANARATRQYRSLIYALWIYSASIYGFAPCAQAQGGSPEPIRVESNEVLVPVLVLDQKRLGEIHQMDVVAFLNDALARDSSLLAGVAVDGLSAKDFRIFQDGKEQVIERVTRESVSAFDGQSVAGGEPPNRNRRTGTARVNIIRLPNWPGYVIAYAPPPSADGSCHQVVVRVDRPDSLVYARAEYCNIRHAVNDTLRGTQLGNQMEADLNSGKPGSVRLSLIVFPAFRDVGDSYRTDVIVESPTKPRRLADCTKLPKIGVLGIFYRIDGTIADRFSGLLWGDLSSSGQSLPSLAPGGDKSCVLSGPDVYGTRLDLTPGHYLLRVVLRNGKHFGRAEISTTLDGYAGQELAISDVALARRHRQVSDGSPDDDAAKGRFEPLISKGFEVTPTANTRFKKGDPFDFYFEIYNPQQPQRPPGTVKALLRILDVKTGQVAKELNPVDAAPYAKPDDPVIPIGGGIDISALPSGSYELEVQAKDSAGNVTPWRAINFAIE